MAWSIIGYRMRTAVAVASVMMLLSGCLGPSGGLNMVRGTPIVFTGSADQPNGAWCWFQDERAIVATGSRGGPVLLFTSVSAGQQESTERGDLDLHWLVLETGEKGAVELADRFEQDDHNVAALHQLDDGRTMAVYAKHGSDNEIRYRLSSPYAPSSWGRESSYVEEAPVTYSNLLTAGADRSLLNFSRSRGWNPNFVVFDPATQTWQYGGRLLASQGRPYVKYANTRSGDIIHVVATDQHPRDFNNSIYHGMTDGRVLMDADGRVIDGDLSDQEAATPSQLSLVFQGDADNVAWMADVETDGDDRPVIAFSVQKDGRGLPPRQGGFDHRYHLARFIGGRWVQHEIAYAGERLYPFEDDYTGLVAIDPLNPDYLVISTNAHPDTGEPLVSDADGKRHYELFEGRSKDEGASFKWRPLTLNSTEDNLRPIIPNWDGPQRIVLWMRGSYRSYTDWDTQIYGVVHRR
jgi:hypothetical protein